MIGMLVSIVLSGAFGMSIALILLRCQAAQEYVVAVGHAAEYRALAEGISLYAVRLYQYDHLVRNAVEKRGLCERQVKVPLETRQLYTSTVVYQRIDAEVIAITVTLYGGEHKKRLLGITRVVELKLLGYTESK